MDHEVCGFGSIQVCLIAWIRELGCARMSQETDIGINLNNGGMKPNEYVMKHPKFRPRLRQG